LYARHVQACADLAEFLADPVGRCFAGKTWLYFYAQPGFCGFIVWGRPSHSDLERLVRVLEVELGSPEHVSLVDARRVEGADPRGFAVLEHYVRTHHVALGRAVKKLAIVRPDGLVGAITSGFFGVTPPPYPVEIFEDRARAVRWLDVANGDAALEDLAREERRAGGSPLLRDLRAILEARPGNATLASAAKSLGMSDRSLQRRLGDHDTTFQAEVNHARVRIAKRLLRESDAKLTQIAHDVGCASLASFSALFRRATGETPSAWRASRGKRGDGD
jgi:AraC-like DNA-binding protein